MLKPIPRPAKTLGPVLLLSLLLAVPCRAAPAAGIDPQAVKLLKGALTFLSSQAQFGVHTRNTIEDLLDAGHRVDFDVAADVVVRRPDKLRAERKGDLVDQVFYYDGKTLTLYNPAERVYAKVAAPDTLEATLDFAREALGLLIPAADLVYRDAFPLLMEQVDFAAVVGKAVIGGVRCDHLVFSRPGVDFQVWIADGGRPLIYKYVVTDTGTPARLSVATVMSDWALDAAAADVDFSFAPPPGVQRIEFMRLDASAAATP